MLDRTALSQLQSIPYRPSTLIHGTSVPSERVAVNSMVAPGLNCLPSVEQAERPSISTAADARAMIFCTFVMTPAYRIGGAVSTKRFL